MGYENDPFVDEDGEALMDPYDEGSDREPSPYAGNQIEDESSDEWRRERSPTPAYDEDKVGKPRKRLVKKGARESSPERSGSPAGQAFVGEDLDDWEEEEPAKKRKTSSGKLGKDSSGKKEKRKVLPKQGGLSAGKASSSGSKGYKVGSADQESDPEVQELWDTIAGDNSEDDREGARTAYDNAFIDDTGVDGVDRFGSDNEAGSIGDAPQAEEDNEMNNLFKGGKKKKKNEKSPAELAMIVEDLMAVLEVTAEEDAELNRQSKPAINKLRKLPLLIEVLSKKKLQLEFLDHGVLTLLKNWLEPLPDGSLPNMNIRTAILKLLSDFPIDLEQYDRREQLKKSGLGKVIMFLSRSDEETTANRKLAKELVDKWVSNIMVKEKEKSSNLRKDPAWRHSVQVSIGGDKSYIYLKCNYCEKVVKGGVTRMKEHLSGSHKNVMPCTKVPTVVQEEIRSYMSKVTMSKHLTQQQFNDRVEGGSYYGSGKDSSSLPTLSSRGSRGPMDQFMVNVEDSRDEGEAVAHPQMMSTANVKEARRRVCLDIGRFFYENAIPFNVATSPAYYNMVRSIGNYGRCLKPPSMYELRTWVLKEELSNTEEIIKEIKRSWPQTGVTIMSDGWSDMKNRSLINILVNNPYGTIFLKSVDASDKVKDADFIFGLFDEVVEEIGEHLVVQVVTDNASAYKAAGNKLMEKRKHLYWTPCAAHCIDLMLERLGELPQHKNALTKAKKISKFIYNHSWVLALMRKFSTKELLRPAATRFATAYLSLQSMLEARQPLEAMFTSSQWLGCAWAKKAEGKEVRKIVLNDKFWVSVTYALTTTKPLVQVLRMVDSEKKAAMGYIYNAMDEAKEKIAYNLGEEEASYREIWDIIDARWELQLHRHLHAAGYYLNPEFQYAENKSTNPEIKLGLYHCMNRMIADPDDRCKADLQLVPFIKKEGFFALQQARDSISKRSAVDWWLQFGDGTPELQSFAVRVLGLTCSSSGCERNWSTYNQVHTKRRNRLTTLRMNSLVYIMYNKRLKERNLKRKGLKDDEDSLLRDDIPSDDEWFVDDDIEGTPSDLQQEDLNVDYFEGDRPSTSKTKTTKQVKRKGKQKIVEIAEDEEEWEDLSLTEDEAGEKVIHYDDDSNEDPLSDDNE